MSEDKPDERPAPTPEQDEAPAAPSPAGQGVPGMNGLPAAPSTKLRAPWWLVAVLLVVAVGAGFGAGALVWAGQVDKVYPPGYHALTPEQYDKCVRGMNVFFDGDDPDPVMRAAAAKLRDDNRFESVREETRQQAFEHFKKTFKDQPELVELAHPEALPASVQLMVRKGTTAKQYEAALRAEFPDAEVNFQSWCPPPE